MYCAKCGKQLGDKDLFCGYCGAPTGVNENMNSETTDIPVTEEPRNTDFEIHEKAPAEKQGGIKARRGVMLSMGAIVLFLICLCIFAISCGKESDRNDSAGNESIKPEEVKEETAYTEETQEKAERTEEPLIEKPLLKIARGYDEAGNLVREITYDRDGSKVEYEYDPDGNLITETSFDEQGYQTIRYTYDSTGNVIREFELEYDSNGNTIRERFFSPDSQYESVDEYEYDNDGKVIKKRTMAYTLGEAYDYYEEYDYTYDDDRIKRIDRYNSDMNTGGSKHTGGMELEYDSSGRLIQCREEYPFDDKIVDFNSAADSTLVVSYEVEDCNIVGIREEECDRNGRLLAIRDYNSDGEVECLQKYDYDSRGHCIKRSIICYSALEETQREVYEYEYDSDDQLKVERYYDREGNLNYEITMEYEYYE
ncbi:YD repeat (two copies) [Lachnospiraceae bacterium M18-1]|nr:YD repeat (two copies) [Lachnospiraceae bacterium M18-1]